MVYCTMIRIVTSFLQNDMSFSQDLNTAVERNLVQSFTIQTVARLSPVDSTLPQVIATCEMVKRGIGVHHGGLLPILKEMVEILFSRNLIVSPLTYHLLLLRSLTFCLLSQCL